MAAMKAEKEAQSISASAAQGMALYRAPWPIRAREVTAASCPDSASRFADA
jgi:hypothetical protein